MKSTITRIFTILFLLANFSGFTQTTLEGKLLDAKTGELLIFGTVALYKSDILISATETDLDGYYLFSDVTPDIYDLEGSYIGYITQKQVGVFVNAGKNNQLDLSLNDGALLDDLQIIAYKIPLIAIDNTTSGVTVTAEEIKSLPTKNINATNATNAGIMASDGGAISIRGSRSTGNILYTTDCVKISEINFKASDHPMKSIPTKNTVKYVDRVSHSTSSRTENPLPSSGQITVGEWNDLHNWKDWMTLMEDEEYSIMTERFEIYPTQRYSVLTINEDNAVFSNVPVKLLDNDGNIIWETLTDNAGKAELWSHPFINSEHKNIYTITVDGKEIENPKTIDQGSNTVILRQDCYSPTIMDIVFTVDATSSMSDEIHFLKSELLDVIDRIEETNEDIQYRTGSVFYRDTRDDYITRVSPLSDTREDVIDFVKEQNASGGGDKPEAVEQALEATLSLDWDKDALKLVFLILDAPPHEDEVTMKKIRTQIKVAASKGIKLIPITASGIGRETEFLMKFMAMMTNGTYVFITDDSGIGQAHLTPVVTEYEVEKLNDCMVRLITQYSKSYSCNSDYNSNEDLEIKIYPNPSTQYINIETQSIASKINILASNGMVVKSIKPTDKSIRIELQDLVNGVYTVVIYIDKTIKSKQVIVLK